MKKRIALGVEYHGETFFGWQTQRNVPTIEAELSKALSHIASHSVKLTCAGRTDKGVHALAQVVHFDTVADRLAHNWLLGANTLMPSSIAVKWVKFMPDNFHARFSALERSYCYVIYNHRSRPACLSGHLAWVYYPLNEQRMDLAGKYLIGEHDFSAFRDSDCQAKTAIRTIRQVSVIREGDIVFICIRANAFLHHMVRNIVGVLLLIGRQVAPPDWMQAVLTSRNRVMAAATAPPEGLYLTAVKYESQYHLPSVPEVFPFFSTSSISSVRKLGLNSPV